MQIEMGAIVTLVIYVVGSTIGFVWWMATMTVKLDMALVKLREMQDNNNSYARKEDVARELGVIERNQDTMWTKFEKLKEKVDSNHITKGERHVE